MAKQAHIVIEVKDLISLKRPKTKQINSPYKSTIYFGNKNNKSNIQNKCYMLP